jgi:mono/diheme cytochrome c family protein
MRTTLCTTAVVLAALALVACGKPKPAEEDPGTQPATGTATAGAGGAVTPNVEKAKEIFAQRCTPCHGPTGAGDGAASASLTPKPRNFHDKDWQSSVTDQHIETIIKAGGAAVGKSPAMPGNPDLTDPAVLAGLRSLIRSFGS